MSLHSSLWQAHTVPCTHKHAHKQTFAHSKQDTFFSETEVSWWHKTIISWDCVTRFSVFYLKVESLWNLTAPKTHLNNRVKCFLCEYFTTGWLQPSSLSSLKMMVSTQLTRYIEKMISNLSRLTCINIWGYNLCLLSGPAPSKHHKHTQENTLFPKGDVEEISCDLFPSPSAFHFLYTLDRKQLTQTTSLLLPAITQTNI